MIGKSRNEKVESLDDVLFSNAIQEWQIEGMDTQNNCLSLGKSCLSSFKEKWLIYLICNLWMVYFAIKSQRE